MDIGLIRGSSYGQYDYCQMSYYITYVLGYQQPTQKKALLGTITHKVMEVLANCKKVVQDNPKKKKFLFNDDEIGILKFTYQELMSQEFVDDLLNKSYEHYTTHAKHLTFDFKDDMKFCRDMVDAGLTMFNGAYDPRNQNIFKAEQPFQFVMDKEWAKYTVDGEEYYLTVKGTMDLIVKENEDTLHLVDYKTGLRKNWATDEVKDQEKLNKDFQLMLYYYAVRKLFPEYKNVMVTIIFLRDGGPFSVSFKDDTIEEVEKLFKEHFETVKQNTWPKPVDKARKDFRCYRLCEFYKKNWDGTNMPMCNHVEQVIAIKGIEKATEILKKPDFKVGFYQKPGSSDKDRK